MVDRLKQIERALELSRNSEAAARACDAKIQACLQRGTDPSYFRADARTHRRNARKSREAVRRFRGWYAGEVGGN